MHSKKALPGEHRRDDFSSILESKEESQYMRISAFRFHLQGGRYNLRRLDLLVVGCDDVQTLHIVQSEDVFLHRFPPITTLPVGIIIYLYIYGLLGCGFAAVPCQLRGKTRRVFFLYEKGAYFCFSFPCTARLFRRRILSSPQPIIENCGSLVRFLAPCAALAFIAGTSHYDRAKTLLAGVGAAAAQFVVAAPSGAWI